MIFWLLIFRLFFCCIWLLINVDKVLFVVVIVWKLLVKCKLIFFIGIICVYLLFVVLFLIFMVGLSDGL